MTTSQKISVEHVGDVGNVSGNVWGVDGYEATPRDTSADFACAFLNSDICLAKRLLDLHWLRRGLEIWPVTGFEALLRWEHPELAIPSRVTMIPL